MNQPIPCEYITIMTKLRTQTASQLSSVQSFVRNDWVPNICVSSSMRATTTHRRGSKRPWTFFFSRVQRHFDFANQQTEEFRAFSRILCEWWRRWWWSWWCVVLCLNKCPRGRYYFSRLRWLAADRLDGLDVLLTLFRALSSPSRPSGPTYFRRSSMGSQ